MIKTNHIAGVSKMVTLGSGANREVEQIEKWRIICLLVMHVILLLKMEIRERRLLWEKNLVMMWLYRIARSGGLLALEYEVGFIPKDMPLCKEICTMMRFVTDGTEPYGSGIRDYRHPAKFVSSFH